MLILFTIKQSRVLLNELRFNRKIDLVQGIGQLTKTNAGLKESTDRILITYEIYYSVADEKAPVRKTMTLPVVKETVLQNMVQTVEASEEVKQEGLETFLHLFKRSVSNKSKRVGRLTGSLKKKAEKQQKSTVSTTTPHHSYFLAASLIFLAIGVFIGASSGSQSRPTSQNDSKLEERLTHLQKQVHEQSQVDVVTRFFLSSPYSGEESDKATQKQVRKYVSEEVLKEIKGSKEQIRTLFLRESKKEGSQWPLMCVVILKIAKEETEIRQMKVTMEKKNSNYQVTEPPGEKEFIINE